MSDVILLNKLSRFNDDDFDLYRYFKDATSKSFADETEELDTLRSDLILLSEKQYDFAGWLTKSAKALGCKRNECMGLCEDVCKLLGNRIQELCDHVRIPIIASPTKMSANSALEVKCPYSSEYLVAYGSCIENAESVKVDGKVCKVIETKLEVSPYYTIKISSLDL